MIEIDSPLCEADFVEALVKTDCFVFLSKHASAKGIASFTVHAEGNWSAEADFGGKPKKLGMSSPTKMLAALKAIKERNNTPMPVLYEATHHGPLLETPSFFFELGGDKQAIEDTALARVVAESVVAMLLGKSYLGGCEKIAIGIGGMHYSEKFTKLALEKGYAFAHILPRYQAQNVDMLDQAIERSDSKVGVAVIEWKGIKAENRDRIIKRLDEIGMDYERV
jgi:D-aminoacyl-tRNA deacylase